VVIPPPRALLARPLPQGAGARGRNLILSWAKAHDNIKFRQFLPLPGGWVKLVEPRLIGVLATKVD